MRSAWTFAVIAAATLPGTAAAQNTIDAALQNQWFTGSLEAPSPALPKAGLMAIEPYAIYVRSTGTYDASGAHHSAADAGNQFESVTAFKYGITDRLSAYALPSFSHVWNGTANKTGVGDLPAELEYRFRNEVVNSPWPSATISVGMSFPTGNYDGLVAPLDGLGSGAYTAKAGLLLQSLFASWGNRPMRVRLYGIAFQPTGDVSVHDISVYGTSQGFRGQAAPGFSAKYGLGVGYGMTRRLVFAVDLLRANANGAEVKGTDASDVLVNMRAVSSTTSSVAPAIEYNWSGRLGIIGGIEFSAAGRSSGSYVSPQIALSTAF